MKRGIHLIILLVGIFSHAIIVDAAPAKRKAGKKSGQTIKTKNRTTEAADVKRGDSAAASASNQSVRVRRPRSVSALFTPLSDFVLQYGAGGSYNINPEIQLGFNFLSGSRDMLSEMEQYEEDNSSLAFTQVDISGMAAYIYGRYFVTDTFNVKAGLGYRSASIAYQITDETSQKYLKGNVATTSYVLPLGMGNLWNWDNGLFVGVDWAVYMLVISGGSSASTETNFEVSDEFVGEMNQDMLDTGVSISKTSSLTLALINIGYAF